MRRPPTGPIPQTARPWLIALIFWLGSAPVQAQVPPPPVPAETPKTGPKPAPKSDDPPPKATKPVAKHTSGRAKSDDDAPIVMSSEAMAKARGKTPDFAKYGEGPDFNSLPAWRQTSFFGIKAEGQLFVYVVDCSGSMIDEDRLDRAKAELRRTINSLQSPQRFKVIFYNDQPLPMPGEVPKPADYPSKAQLARWLNLIEPEGPTDPRSSLALALSMRPDAVFLLSDGAFPEGTTEAVARLNPKKVPIHCIDLANGAAGDDLRKIAAESGGQYAAKGR